MTEFEKALQECLQDLERGAASVDECLRRYPGYAQQLEPILLASARLERAGEMQVSGAFKARGRSRLVQEMRAHPRTSRREPVGARSRLTFMRLVVGIAAVLLALLATGTAYAQSALPGQMFYGWKIASENAWRAVSADPVGADLVIAERRTGELVAVKDDPAARAQALEAYLETVDRLQSQAGIEDQLRVTSTLDSQRAVLKKLGILLAPPDPAAVPSGEATPTPSATPLSIAQTPGSDLTAVPSLTPTVPPSATEIILPTIEVPPELVPTIHIPPPIR
jgi:hypothetical protein